MSQGKRRKRVSTEEEKCEIISCAISNIIATSENADFVAKCRQIIQGEDKGQMKNKLKMKFMEVATNKKTTNEMITDSEKQSDSFDSFIENIENSSNVWEELDGFDIWEDS